MVERQRAHAHGLRAARHFFERRPIPGLHLQHIGAQIAVQQHGPFGHAGGATGVLQRGNVVWRDIDLRKLVALAFAGGIVKADAALQLKRGHQLFAVAHHPVNDAALEQAQHIAHAADNDLVQLAVRGRVLHRGAKVLQHDHHLGAAVFQLVVQLRRGVERVDVHHHQARTQHRGHGRRVLGHVGHHQGHAVALHQGQGLQIGSQCNADLVHLPVAKACPHKVQGRAVCMLDKCLVQQLHQGGHMGLVYVFRDFCRVGRQPRAFCHAQVSKGRRQRAPGCSTPTPAAVRMLSIWPYCADFVANASMELP